MQIHEISLDKILIPKDRQRKTFSQDDLMALAESIKNKGLFHPIIVDTFVDDTYTLIAGERRYRAHEMLGRKTIFCHVKEDLPETLRQEIELEENLRRVNLTWQEEVDAVQKYHDLKVKINPDWTQADTGTALGYSGGRISVVLRVADVIKNNPEMAKAPQMRSVYNAEVRKDARAFDAVLENALDIELADDGSVIEAPAIHLPEKGMAEPTSPHGVIHGDFISWVQNYTGPKFNLIHCDFPYGVNMDTSPLHGQADHVARYEDTPEVYFQLLRAFINNQDRFITQSAHCLFWFSHKFYPETLEAFEAAGWAVNRMPLIWAKSDLKGILPDPQRGPRQCYESALLLSRGDRKIVRAVANLVIEPTTKATGHISEKPLSVVSHFLGMLVDHTTLMLDPTCGSATALRAGIELGAKVVLGLEKDEDSFRIARQTLKL